MENRNNGRVGCAARKASGCPWRNDSKQLKKRNNRQYIVEYDSPVGPLTLASDGENLTGSAGGVDKKTLLLKLEGADLPS